MARESASFHLLDPDPRAILKTLSLSTKARNTIRQNLGFSVVYNVIAIPMAMAGFLNPLVAVLAMFASSLTVIGNSSRLRRSPIARRAAADA
jgi:Cu+-exporting ATPase